MSAVRAHATVPFISHHPTETTSLCFLRRGPSRTMLARRANRTPLWTTTCPSVERRGVSVRPSAMAVTAAETIANGNGVGKGGSREREQDHLGPGGTRDRSRPLHVQIRMADDYGR